MSDQKLNITVELQFKKKKKKSLKFPITVNCSINILKAYFDSG